MARPKDLGMGLEALFSENESTGNQAQTLRLTEIFPNKNQPRTDFDDRAIETLADSIRQHGVLQPLLVRPMSTGGYQIVAGERRWRAARIAGLDEVPVYVKELSDAETAQLALVENLQRENLNPVEEALGFKELMSKHGLTQDQVAKIVGRSRPAVANSLRLLSLDDETLRLVRDGEVSPGHAKALLGVSDKTRRLELVQEVKRGKLTVRALEDIVKRESQPKKVVPKCRESLYHEVELAIKEQVGRVCTVKGGKSGSGTLSIEFYDRDDLMAIARLLESLNKPE